ncbi:MAG: hypothetical protein HZB76_02195 [Chlamydiae bacterium]|nr:hypothetical protein [Chlamydiota bacterium]
MPAPIRPQSAFSAEHKLAVRVTTIAAIMVAITAIIALGIYLGPASLLAGITFVAVKISALPILVCIGGLGVAAVGLAAISISKKEDPNELHDKRENIDLESEDNGIENKTKVLAASIEDFYNTEVKGVALVHRPEDAINKILGEFERFRISFINDKNQIEDAMTLKFYEDRFNELKAEVLNAKEKVKK